MKKIYIFNVLVIVAGFLLQLTGCGEKLPTDEDIETPYTPLFSFEWILDDEIKPESVRYADYIDIDGFDNSAAIVADLQDRGMKVIGYISVGTIEDWRPDASSFPDAIVGRKYGEWNGERWLDISNLSVIGPLLEARLDMLVEKGFDGIEPDNMDVYDASSGFDISKEDAIIFCKWLAAEAHERGLSIGQKNVPELTPELVTDFDWILTEDAFVQGWEEDVTAYEAEGKPVFAVEYTDEKPDYNEFCIRAQQLNYTLLFKKRDLDTWSFDCDGN